jgi:hypothetical protein
MKHAPFAHALSAGVAMLILAAGCTPEPTEEMDPSFVAEHEYAEDEALLADDSDDVEIEAPAFPGVELPFEAGATDLGAGEAKATAEGLPAFDDEGRPLNTLAALELAVDYYQRVLVTWVPEDEDQERYWKPIPPLTDLQQLVEYRIIRAVPEGPDGQRYVYDAEAGRVKLVSP